MDYRKASAEKRWDFVKRAAREIGLAYEAEDLAQEAALQELESGRIASRSREACIWAARRIYGESKKTYATRVASPPWELGDSSWLERAQNPEPLMIEALDLLSELDKMPWLPAQAFIEVEMRGTRLEAFAGAVGLSPSRAAAYLQLAKHALRQSFDPDQIVFASPKVTR